ncbi:MAG: hypothetical protein KBF28_08920 [Gemmatimonadales bacterium]|nr:hypothetical protein [Gemmatimonadales bacterium]
MRLALLLPLLAALAALGHTRGEIIPAPAMRTARMAHTATTLRDGRVLVAGGFAGESHAAVSAELYDPVTNRFLALPRMLAPRHSHTATLLPDGRVLLAGGYAADGAVASAELFDPATRRFLPVRAMHAARAGHVAVPLESGKVLLVGGVGPDWTFLSSAELYDPATGRFTTTGSMSVARESHAAVRLLDGRVLIIGGHRGRRADITLYASAEAYDPRSGIFSSVGGMRNRRHKHDAVLLQDGRVLVMGGSDERDNRGMYRSTELFDPRTNAFSEGPEMQRERYKHVGSAVVLPNGQVLLAGGAAEAELFTPGTNRFSLVAGAVPVAGLFSAVALIGTTDVLITGGYGHDRGPQAAAWRYRP